MIAVALVGLVAPAVLLAVVIDLMYASGNDR